MSKTYTRREMLRLGGAAVVGGTFFPQISRCKEAKSTTSLGAVAGDPDGTTAGMKVLAEGGNAIDAVIAAALVTCVVAESKCGLAGYGGHMTIALTGGKKVTSIDYNSAAPAAARADMYPLDEKGRVKNNLNSTGWLAVGVPGTLAGMQLALDRYGTKSFRELVQPAISLARNGFPLSAGMGKAIAATAGALRRFPASAKLLLKDGQPIKAGETFRNNDLAQLLQTLADRNSVDSFYRGDIGQRIADEFKKNGGIVTARDLADYHAREVEPLQMRWKDSVIHTAPLTAGGLSILQMLTILREMNWAKLPTGFAKTHGYLEALRLCWRDRLEHLGDPAQAEVPIKHLLAADYARELGKQVRKAVKEKRALPIEVSATADDGTMNLSAVDCHGNMVAMTLTQGGSFGSKVTVEGLGLVLGHGMWRFEPKPGHPNSVAPGKRPLHNMCPSVVLRKGKPVMAVGGAGGRMIPNSILKVLTDYVALEKTMDESIAAPRLHNEGNMNVMVEHDWPASELVELKQPGYNISIGKQATISAVSFNAKTGECNGATR